MLVTASIVLYETPDADIDHLYEDISNSDLKVRVYIIDNSPKPVLDEGKYRNATYVFMGRNCGYGAGHNVALARAAEDGSSYHFILNPDVRFGSGVLRALVGYIDGEGDIGCVMPKILNTDGTIQHLCRLLPTPSDLIGRRFLRSLFPSHITERNARYELSFWNYDTTEHIPVLSGCFMLLRMSIVQKVGAFDERFFMYLEDYDLVRRIGSSSRTMYYPLVSATHAHARKSYKTLGSTIMHIRSAIQYFNKWGWFFDAERQKANTETLKRILKTMHFTKG